jgi:hypothetical protein
MKKLFVCVLVVLFASSLMAIEPKVAPAQKDVVVKEVPVVPAIPACEGKKVLKKCAKAKHVAKVEKKFKCTCPVK